MPPLGNILTDPQCAARLGAPEALILALQQQQQHPASQPAFEDEPQHVQQVLHNTSSFLEKVASGRFEIRPAIQQRVEVGQTVPGSQLLSQSHTESPSSVQQQRQQTHVQLALPHQQQSIDGGNSSSSRPSSTCSSHLSDLSPHSCAGPSPVLAAAASPVTSGASQPGMEAMHREPQAAAELAPSSRPGAAATPSTCEAGVRVVRPASMEPAAASSSSAAAAAPPAAAAAMPVTAAVAPTASTPQAAAPTAAAAEAAAARLEPNVLTATPAKPHPNHKWAVEYVRELLLEWQQQQQQQQPQQPVEGLAEAASLKLNPEAYAWLNAQLQRIRVYCEVAKDCQALGCFASIISCLDPRAAADISHSTHSARSGKLEPSTAAATISCERYIHNKYGVQLQLQRCPCIVVELSEEAEQQTRTALGSSSEDPELYRHYPLEFCWLLQKSDKHESVHHELVSDLRLKRRDPRHTWMPIAITPDPAGPTARTPPWIAAAMIKAQLGEEDAAQPETEAAAAAATATPQQSVQSGIQSLIAALLPSKDERRRMRGVVEAVSNDIARAQQSGAWTVRRAKSVGSFEKHTNLAGTSDLDIVTVLKCNTPKQQPFEACRMQLLDQVQQQLCAKLGVPPAPAEDAAHDQQQQQQQQQQEKLRRLAAHGWELLDCVPFYYLTLRHRVLCMQLDVQVAQYYGETQEAQWQGVMQPLQQNTRAAADSRQPPVVMPARQRSTDLTELSVLVVTGTEELYKQQHGQPSGYGRLATDVIRLCKAFAKFGLPVALAAAARSAAEAAAAAAAAWGVGVAGAAATAACSSSGERTECSAGSATAPFKGPPAFIWEILVLYVLQQHAAAGTFYQQSDPLTLFMAVLSEASVLLRTGDADEALQRAIILDMSCVHPDGYTEEQARQFRNAWGSGRLHTPYIIHPVDPTFNCTIMQPFRAWDTAAEAAGQLHAQLEQALAGGSAAAAATAAAGEGGDEGGGCAGGGDAWQRLLSSSTLGPVWDAFKEEKFCPAGRHG